MFNMSSENNDWLQQFSKTNFKKKSHLNTLGSKFDLDVK